MTAIQKITELADKVGESVIVDCWVINIRRQGKKLCFLSLYDGTGTLQATIKQNAIGEEKFSLLNNLYRGASLQLSGNLQKDIRAPEGFELQVTDILIYHPSAETYDQEITPESGQDVLLSKRHIVLRGPKSASVLRLQSHVIRYLREYFEANGLEEIYPPLITETQAEGGSELFEITYFDTSAYLTQSSQLYLEAGIFALRDVYCVLPSFRAEKSRTKRHLTEYRHIETEHAFMNFEQLLQFLEKMIRHVVKRVKQEDQDILSLWDRTLEFSDEPFKRIEYKDAIDLLKNEYQIDIPHGEDISDAPERKLVEHFGGPVILQHFPTAMKPFYHKIEQNRPDVTQSADFLFPICGELIGSGERETEIESMLDRMAKMDPPLNPDEFYWYMDLRRYGSVPHSGFGMGLERLIQWLLGLDSVREATLFPRTMTRLSP